MSNNRLSFISVVFINHLVGSIITVLDGDPLSMGMFDVFSRKKLKTCASLPVIEFMSLYNRLVSNKINNSHTSVPLQHTVY